MMRLRQLKRGYDLAPLETAKRTLTQMDWIDFTTNQGRLVPGRKGAE